MTTTGLLERVRSLKVRVIDDRREEGEDIRQLLAGNQVEAEVVVPLRKQSMEELARELQGSPCTAVLCDHRLSETSGVRYTGAQLASALNRLQLPSVLFSSFTDPEHSPEIRAELAHLPSYLSRDQLYRFDQIAIALDVACNEVLLNQPPLTRQKFPTVVRVVEVRKANGKWRASVIVPAFDPRQIVEIPLADLDIALQDAPHLAVGRRYMALINVCAESAHEVFVTDARPAVEL
ncbi:hypothetical protein ACLQ28_31475 [Micromonospora sp. DT201]|uniref:hypothetical protein n=1 Tax=Micromonospora sp. DT201 TaxID=3393442 RepID=UPI003CF4DCFE